MKCIVLLPVGMSGCFAVFAQFELGILQGCAGAWINNGVGGPKGRAFSNG